MVNCDDCHALAELVSGDVVYPHRPDLASKRFWRCAPCQAWVGCHEAGNGHGDGTQPLGRLANAELRRLRGVVHAAFDPLWKGGHVSRSAAYRWLHQATGIPLERCHIAMLDAAECELVHRTLSKATAEGTLPHQVARAPARAAAARRIRR